MPTPSPPLASGLTEAEWHSRIPNDGRKVGVVVHHVATMYPLEIQLGQTLAAANPVLGVTWDVALELLRKNSSAAAAAIRALSDEELDRAVPVSLNAYAPVTCQFMLEHHAVRQVTTTWPPSAGPLRRWGGRPRGWPRARL